MQVLKEAIWLIKTHLLQICGLKQYCIGVLKQYYYIYYQHTREGGESGGGGAGEERREM